MFIEKDIKLLKERGIPLKEAERQITFLKKGFPFIRLAKAASVNDGIKKLNEQQLKEFINKYENSDEIKRIKFIPASGAATRMFKVLFEFDELFRQSNYDPKLLSREAYKHVKECFDRIKDFAFYPELEKVVSKSGHTLTSIMKNGDYHIVLSSLLNGDGLNYGNLPKGLLTFHRYDDYSRTAVEEHLVEGTGYAANKNSEISIHLTVSPEHIESFDKLLKKVQRSYEERFHVKYNISYSIQKKSTDTLSLNDKNEPFRETDGTLHFRPGGHGALLDNLNDINADIIFIKNIDNVCHDRVKNNTITYKKALAGVLIYYQEKIFNYIRILEKAKDISSQVIDEIVKFLGDEMGITIKQAFINNHDEAIIFLKNKLNRPLRVCGMVQNIGEPGGGPFWTIDQDGNRSLQIVESSQVDMHDPEQAAIINSSTHFNPVDIVCGVNDHKGKKFNLLNFRNSNTGFVSKKFKNGKALKALELPGLWNGSMSDWNTIFIEVPLNTFTPVKTVYDLLRPEHQSL